MEKKKKAGIYVRATDTQYWEQRFLEQGPQFLVPWCILAFIYAEYYFIIKRQ